MSTLAVLIPAYKEEATIAELVRRVKKLLPDVCVVDDGSSDSTASRAEAAGAFVIKQVVNQGKGEAIRAGLRHYQGREVDAVIMLDADLQHLPEEIVRFIEKYQKESPSIIVGSRAENLEKMPLLRKLTNQSMSFLISKLCRQKIPDTQCGFRLLDKKAIGYVLAECSSSNYDFETEMLIVLADHDIIISSVPITTVYQNEVSKINKLRDTARFIKLLWRRGLFRKLFIGQ